MSQMERDQFTIVFPFGSGSYALTRNHLNQFIQRKYFIRKWWSYLVCKILFLLSLIALSPLLSVFSYVLKKGIPGLSFSFLIELPKPVGELGGGLGNSILGTLILIMVAAVIGIPWGLGLGVYLSEYGKNKLGASVRLSADIFSSIPSIVVGLFVYTIVVLPMKRFSAWAGGLALGLLIIPSIARTTEELLRLVPNHIREAGLALGMARWLVIIKIVVGGSRSSILTGVMLPLARVTGETAPLLFTALNNRYWPNQLDQPISSLPVQIYTYAISPFAEWHQQAWAGALILVLLVFIVNLVTRFVITPQRKRT